MKKTAKKQILSRIYGRGRGWAFTPNDFIQDFKRWEIDNSLEDLSKTSASYSLFTRNSQPTSQ